MATALVSTGIQFPDNSIQTSNVTNTLTGVIAIWSGTTANIPEGWALCDGSNSTPNLSDFFVIGAGDTYSVNATGGSANAILASHTHSTTSNTYPAHVHVVSHTHTGNIASNGIHNHTATIALANVAAHTHPGSVVLSTSPTHTHPSPGTTGPGGAHTHSPFATGTSGQHQHSFPFQGYRTVGRAPQPLTFSIYAGDGNTVPAGKTYPFPFFLPPSMPQLGVAGSNPAQSSDHGHPMTTTSQNQWPHYHEVAISNPNHAHPISAPQITSAPAGSHNHANASATFSVAPNLHDHTTAISIDPVLTSADYSNAGIHTHVFTVSSVVESTSSLENANLPPYYSLAFIMKV